MSRIRKINKLLSSGKISCTELTRSYLDAVSKDDKLINSYVRLTPDIALAAAAAADKKLAAGETLSPLEGVPMTLKDNISTKGVETTCCSEILKGYVPIYNATVWNILSAKGSVLLGKTNMDEFAMGSSCENSCFGAAKNPHNIERVPGGSSGGAAAAVAANLAAFSLGSDTGGSIRQPASFCGLVGLKPTYGAVSRFGLIAYASGFDQIGPITQTAEDAALVLDAICSKDEMDSTSTGAAGGFANALDNDVAGKKIGIAPEYFEGVQSDVAKAVENAARVFSSLGAQIVPVSIPSVKYALPVYYILACAEASSNLGRYDGIRYGHKTERYGSIHEMICKTRSEGFSKEVQRRILLGTYVLSAGYYDAYYKKAQNLRGTIVGEFSETFNTVDAILTPTAPTAAFKSGFCAKDPVKSYQADFCTVPVNIAGLPAVSVPCGFDCDGLPIGMQLIGNRFAEAKILNLAHKFEQATEHEFEKQLLTGVAL